MADYIQFIEIICNDLEIEKPLVEEVLFLHTPTQLAEYIPSDNILKYRPGKIPLDTMFSIAHELRHIWQMKNCPEIFQNYILAELDDRLLIFDKHAAHERVRFDALKAATEPIMSQTLLEPMAVELSPEDCAAVLEQLPLLERYGFRCEDFGGAVLVRGVPAGVDDPTGALEELAEDLRLNRADPDTARDSLLQTMACKSAIKAGMWSDPSELQALADKVQSGEIRYCPHGRPVAVKLSKYEMEKMFKRA